MNEENGQFDQDEDTLKAERLARLSPNAHSKLNLRYSRIIRRVALVLPVIALILLITVLNWNTFKQETISPLQEEAKAIAQQTIGKNELLNPQFQSVDEKGQPFTITAARATQDEIEEDLLALETPLGIMKLNNGATLTLGSNEGTYRQEGEKLYLKNNVVMTHQEQGSPRGYEMKTEELYVDTGANKAWSDVKVTAQGPAGTLEAEGMQANSADETLIFTGPAKLVLTLENGLDLESVSP